MTAAVVDIGSNSVLLLVGTLSAAGEVHVTDRALATTRLGSGLAADGCLTDVAKERTTAAVLAFVRQARAGGARVLAGFATGAARRARDGDAFVHRLAQVAGMPIEILSGAAEGMLAYQAACDGSASACAVVDVGGATTEITLGHGPRTEPPVSLPLGALVLTEAFGGSVAALDRAGITAAIAAALAPVALLTHIRDDDARLVASGGTATALAALDLGLTQYNPERVHGHHLALGTVERMAAADWGIPAGLDPRRAEILPAGALVLLGVMRAAGASRATVSDRGVSYAYLERLLRTPSPAGTAR